MKRVLFIFLLFIAVGGCVMSAAFGAVADDGFYYTKFRKKELLRDLAFAERQVFDSVYTSDTMQERLERLELEVFGALQDGSEDFRIKKLRKSVTNVSSGGSGLNNLTKTFNLAGNASGTSNWAIGNMHNFYPYSNSYYSGRNYYSHRVPPRGGYSHRLPPPPPPPNYNSNPIVNGDFMKNYSIGTGIKILDD